MAKALASLKGVTRIILLQKLELKMKYKKKDFTGCVTAGGVVKHGIFYFFLACLTK